MIDAATGESEIYSSVLKRSIQCAESMRNMGLKTGDVVVLMGSNHLDMCIPFYAALYLGLAVSPTAATFKSHEYLAFFEMCRPKVVFCQNDDFKNIKPVLDQLGLETKLIIFEDEKSSDRVPATHFKDFLNDNSGGVDVENFKASDFDPTEVLAIIMSTSGTCGMPKGAAISHFQLTIGQPYIFAGLDTLQFPKMSYLLWAPVQWISCLSVMILSPLYGLIRIQNSNPLTVKNWLKTVKKYKPMASLMSPTYASEILRSPEKDDVDLSCFFSVTVGGNAISTNLLDEMKKLMVNAYVFSGYAMSETNTIIFFPPGQPKGSSGSRMGHFQYRLVDPMSGEDITQSHVNGELWLKGPSLIKYYYNNPESTAEAFTKDGWFKTGDIFYRDDLFYYYYVERLKLMFKYRSTHITPTEIENVIRLLPDVIDVVVTGVPDAVCGDLPVALVVTRKESKVTAQEIKDIVKDNLMEDKELKGGVIFLESLPMLANTKVDRKKIKELVSTMERL